MPRTEVVFYKGLDGAAPALKGIRSFLNQGRRAVLSHVTMKEGKVPETEMDRAILHKALFRPNPDAHTLRV